MVHHVKYAGEGPREVGYNGAANGIVPSPDQVAEKIRATVGRTRLA